MASPLTASASQKGETSKTEKKNEQHTIMPRKRKEQQRHQPPVNQDDDNDDVEIDAEQRLMSTLFGTNIDTTSVIANSKSLSKKKKRSKKQHTEAAVAEFTFEIDRIGSTNIPTDDIDNDDDPDSKGAVNKEKHFTKLNSTETAAASNKRTQKTVAWVDDDDDDNTNVGGVVDFVHASDRIRKLRQHKEETHVPTRSLYEERLRQRYIQTTQTTSNVAWAQTANQNHQDRNNTYDTNHPNDVSISTSYLKNDHSVSTNSNTIPPPHMISMKRCPDANRNDPHLSVTKVVQFYRPPIVTDTTSVTVSPNNKGEASSSSPTLLLTAGLDKTLRFFHCAEESSTKIHGVHFPNFPIYSASFIGSSSNVVVTGRRPFFYIYDTVADKVQQIPPIQNRNEKSWERCVVSPHDNNTVALLGNDGYIILYNIQQQKPCTTQPIKLNGSVRTVAFNQYNSNELLASGSDGDIYRYDLRYQSNYKCIERFHNDDGTITSQIATSSQTFAVAAESGVVNIYNNNSSTTTTESVLLSQSPSLLRGLSTISSPLQRQPIKSIMNIKTCVDTMTYNHDGSLLAIASRFEKDCMKLVHVPTGTVYSNWPTSNTPLGYVFSMDFSPQSNFIAIGNDQGKCLLYKLTHYE